MNAEIAKSLHGKLSAEESLRAERSREEMTFSLILKTCNRLKDFAEFINSSEIDQLRTSDSDRYRLQASLARALESIYIRAMAGHGTETKSISILQHTGVLVAQDAKKVGDYFGKRYEESTNFSIKNDEDGIHVSLNNIPVHPKNYEYSAESPGYYDLEVVLSKDIDVIEDSMHMAENKLAELDSVE